MEIAIKKFKNHLSVQIIKKNICAEQEFDLEQVEIDDILKEIKKSNNNNNNNNNNNENDISLHIA